MIRPRTSLGIQHQRWNTNLLLFSICWVRPDGKNPSQKVLVEEFIYEGDLIWSNITINWRAERSASFTAVIDHCFDLASAIKIGEFSPFDLRTDDGYLAREIFLAALHEQGYKIGEDNGPE